MKSLPISARTFFSRAISVAEHYGFCSVDDLSADPTRRKGSMRTHESPDQQYDHHVLSRVLADLAEQVELRKRQSLMFYTPSVIAKPGFPNDRVSALTLNSIGSHDPLTEIILIQSAASILEELGLRQYTVRVNSIGDSDSAARFIRDVGGQVKQRVRELPDEYVDMVRTDIASAVAALYESRHPLSLELPSPLDYLTAPSRKHFKDILELLEHTGIPFVLDDKLYGRHSMYAHTLYEFVDPTSDTGTILARGGRYDHLTRAFSRSTIPAAGIVIAVDTKDTLANIERTRKKHPRACLIHIGREARIRSIGIVETFRREKIPIEQCLQFERFSEQIAYAESQKAKYVLILGQREVHQNVVIVRDASDRSQQTIAIDLLPTFLKTHV